MTPAEADQARRDAAIRRGRRIETLQAGQQANFIHRLAAIVPGDVDRVLGEFEAAPPKPRTEPKLHPVTFGGAREPGCIIAVCPLPACTQWHWRIEPGHDLADLERLVREHSGILS